MAAASFLATLEEEGFSFTPATLFSFKLPELGFPLMPPRFNPVFDVFAVVVAGALPFACELLVAFAPKTSWLLPALVAVVSSEERVVAREDGRVDAEAIEAFDGTLRVVRPTVFLAGKGRAGDDDRTGEDEGGRLGFPGERLSPLEGCAGRGGGGILSRAEVPTVFFATLFLGTTSRPGWAFGWSPPSSLCGQEFSKCRARSKYLNEQTLIFSRLPQSPWPL